MTEQTENLVLEYLRAMRADISTIKQDIREIKMRVASLESHIAGILGDVLRQNSRIEDLADRVERIEHRLELQP